MFPTWQNWKTLGNHAHAMRTMNVYGKNASHDKTGHCSGSQMHAKTI